MAEANAFRRARLHGVDELLATNRARWDELVALHAASSFYDVEGFRAGKLSLDSVVRDEVGDVAGCSLLHLQCHFGLDTLSWARLGATVTGVDFSEPAIALARELARDTELDARFLCCELDSLPEALDETFDVVFSSYGALCWLPDIEQWGRLVARYLRPGGRFHLIELHPFVAMFDDESPELRLRYPYFRDGTPIRDERHGSYAVPTARTEHTVTFSWPTPIAAVLGALIAAGLRIDAFHEYPRCNEEFRPGLVEHEDGYWTSPPGTPALPLTYAVRAGKPS
jgi:SAM-dependent methyltransferase